jgi:hypothetical protein
MKEDWIFILHAVFKGVRVLPRQNASLFARLVKLMDYIGKSSRVKSNTLSNYKTQRPTTNLCIASYSFDECTHFTGHT